MKYFNDDQVQALNCLMESLHYRQIVANSTFIAGSLLDHIHVSQHILPRIKQNVVILYYSDHDGIPITVQ